ncbi:MAG TPA: kelch repeat-containing protein [Candidatus Binataceae bacterium]
MNRLPILLPLVAASAMLLSACAGNGIVETPVYYTNPQGSRVLALLMTTPRADHVAIRLGDGRVLLAGGTATANAGGVLASAEIYDPVAKNFTPAGSMTVPRQGQTATTLANGAVLMAGGVQNIGFRSELASAELYDPTAGTFSDTGSMHTPREGHTATLLRDGRVLIAGGSDNGTHALDSAEIYDPASGTFSSAGHMTQPRVAHTATLLRDSTVLIAGGGRGDRPGGYIAYNTAEIYDPVANRFAALTARMVNDRVGAAATLFEDGRVLIVGGRSSRILMTNPNPGLASLTPLKNAEFYDPESHSFHAAMDMGQAHYLPTLTELDRGRILVVGGWLMQGFVVVGMSDAEIFEPSTNTFLTVGKLNTPRLENTATLLPDGEVLVAGGIDGSSNITSSVEFYSPNDRRFLLYPEPSGAPPIQP